MKNMGSVDEIINLDEVVTSPLKRKIGEEEFGSPQSGYEKS